MFTTYSKLKKLRFQGKYYCKKIKKMYVRHNKIGKE